MKCFRHSKPIRVKKAYTCEECGKQYESTYEGSHFCSRECQSRWVSRNRRGPNHHGWKGGISYEPYTPEFNEAFRCAIRDRDNHACVLCGIQDINLMDIALAVHHIDGNPKNSASENCIALCSSCHSKVHANMDYYQPVLTAVLQKRLGLEQLVLFEQI